MRQKYSYEEVCSMIVVESRIPSDFDQWKLVNEFGWSVAHVAARYGLLPVLGPKKFTQWDLVFGSWTVGHEAAVHGGLPADFDQWELADIDGRTIAHLAAQYHNLPITFEQWGLATKDGLTVLSLLLLSEHPENHVSKWEKERPLCRTDADWEVFKRELPVIYQKYTVDEAFDDEVNAVQQVHLL